MKIACISDVHATPGSDSYKLLLQFLRSPDLDHCDKIFLMGDIFDIMIGSFSDYKIQYKEYFSQLETLIKQGKKIYIFEGNHDFHLKEFYAGINSNIVYIVSDLKLKIKEKELFFTHGDVVDVDNKAYQRWKSIYTSLPFKLFVKYIVPFWFVRAVGDKASRDSKKRGKKHFDPNLYRSRYRNGAEKVLSDTKTDFLVCGHTHIKEDYECRFGRYINIGFPQIDRTYLLIDDLNISFKSI
jgi:UDP-2,3-diacylglucosamine hydrolase